MNIHTEPYGRTPEGEEVSLYVDDAVFSSSIHADLECIDCHNWVEDLPHEERLGNVLSGNFHEDPFEEYQWHGYIKADLCEPGRLLPE